ncbi:tyrosine-type recombinase/integrase [Nonomuraea sp. LPB2021202275-12-8]|uniref:tyrosine-type recombinase/integrase n=1 Tax=Nonomuraea sp. LPB2021202275-12-8 TaxID=3120159 RepID=UPI00300CD79B
MASDLEVAAEVLSGEVVFPGGAQPIPVRGRAPVSTVVDLKDLMRQLGMSDVAAGVVDGWLGSERRTSKTTQQGYTKDVSWWLFWLAMRGVDPADVAPAEADMYAKAMREQGLKPATRARRIAAASSLYVYLLRAGAVLRDPFAGMDRPKSPTISKTRGLSKAQLDAMLAWAKKEAQAKREKYEAGAGSRSWAAASARTYAMLCMLMVTAARVGGVTTVELGALGWDDGHRVIDLPVKGPDGNWLRFPVPPYAWTAINNYLDFRGVEAGPLFQTDSGKPVSQQAMFGTVQRIAKLAGVPHWGQLSTHGIRGAVATHALRSGVPLHKVQELLGHADPRTTIRYLRKLGLLDESLVYKLAEEFAVGEAELLKPHEEEDY